MRDDIRVNGYRAVIDVTYVAGEEGSWQVSQHAAGPFYSTRELNEQMGSIMAECPEGYRLHIEFQDPLDEAEEDGYCIAGDMCVCNALEQSVCFDWKQHVQ